MSEKKKKNTNGMGTIPFVLLWTLTYGLAWAVALGGVITLDALFRDFFTRLPELISWMMFGAAFGLISSGFQQILIRRKFSVQISNWWLWTTLASIAASSAAYWYNETLYYIIQRLFNYNDMFHLSLIFGVIFAIPAIAQAVMLRGHLKRVWMWPLAAVVSAATFTLPIFDTGSSNDFLITALWGGAGLLQGSVMGLTLAWLFGMTRVEPLKRGLESAQIQQAESNLAEGDSDEAVADYPKEENMRQEQ